MYNTTTSALLLEGLLQVNDSLTAAAVHLLTSTQQPELEFINISTTSPLASTTAATTFEELLLQNTLSLTNKRIQAPSSTEFSPVTLSPEWSRMSRLLLLSGLCILGSVGNIFMISSVVIEDYLKRPGNAFIVNIALADLLLTSVSIPSSAILLLAGIDSSQTVCRIQSFLTACVFIVTVLSILATAIENYVRLCVVRDDDPDDGKHNWFTKANTTGVLLFIWLIGLLLSSFQFITTATPPASNATAIASSGALGFTPAAPSPPAAETTETSFALFEYCSRKNNELLPSGVAVAVTSTLIPLFATFVIYLRIHMTMKRVVRKANYKPNYWFSSDLSLAKSNFFSFIVFILFWTPFAVVACLATTRPITNKSFYNSAWVGMSKSCFFNIIYCLTHRHFRNAYVNLFNYCCCKTSFVATSRRHRDCGTSSGAGATGSGTGRPASDVRVHIIPGYNMYSYTSPQRRDVHEL